MLINFKMHQQTELPLKHDKANFFLQISTGVSVFFFSMVLAAYFMTSSVIASWNKTIIDGMTVQIMPSTEAISADEEKVRIGKVIHFFENLDGVEKVALVKEKQIKRLMAPWLGANADVESLPLPKLLNVHLKDGQSFPFEKVSDDLKQVLPYASMDNHGLWLKKLVKSATSIKTLALFVLMLVLATSVLSIVYAVTTSLKVHQNIIEILHIIGATDNYVAKQYARRGCIVGFISSFVGTLIGLIALRIISYLSAGLETGLIGSASLSASHWLVLASVPFFGAFLSTCTSYYCVKHNLKEMY